MTSPTGQLPQDPSRITRKRTEAGLSQPELAEKAGVNRSTVYRVEAGLVPAQARTLRLLAEALDCKISDLMPAEPVGERA